jgi:hypothetical protein
MVGTLLEAMGDSKQTNQKMLQVGEAHSDRNAQFEFIDKNAKGFIDAGEPVISVDTKKKENIGNFKNNGTEYRQGKNPRKVLDHDFWWEAIGRHTFPNATKLLVPAIAAAATATGADCGNISLHSFQHVIGRGDTCTHFPPRT